MFLSISLIAYCLAFYGQILAQKGRVRHPKAPVFLMAVPAIIAHGLLLYSWIDVATGQNLYVFNIVSLVAWLVSILVVLTSISKPAESLGLLIFPVAVASILLVLLFPGSYIINTGANPWQLFHILCGILAFSVLVVAAMQAIIMAWQDRALRKAQGSILARALPPLETMESLLFEMIALGFALLTVVLLAGLFFNHATQSVQLTHSPYLVAIAWVVFAALLFGRHLYGWRGRTAIRWTLGGTVLLIMSYFGRVLMLTALTALAHG